LLITDKQTKTDKRLVKHDLVDRCNDIIRLSRAQMAFVCVYK